MGTRDENSLKSPPWKHTWWSELLSFLFFIFMCFLFLFCIIKIKCLFFTFIFLFIWMQVLFFLIFYSLFCFFIFVIFYKKIIITVFPFPCFICPAPAPGAGIVNFCCRGKELVNCHLEGCRIGLTTTTRTWLWNISGQVRLISGPRFCHLGGCRIGLAETDNGSEWTGSDRHTDRPSELIYRIWTLQCMASRISTSF